MYKLILLALMGQTTIEAPTEVDPHKPIVVTAITQVEPGCEVQYLWQTPTVESISVDGNKTLHIWAKPGQHVISLIAVTFNFETKKFLLEDKRVTITVKGTVVNPPQPPTPPIPPGKVSAALVIYEKDSLTPQQASLLNAIRNKYPTSQLKILDQHLTPQIKEHINNKELPLVIAVNNDSSLGVIVDLPGTVSEFTQLLDSWGIK